MTSWYSKKIGNGIEAFVPTTNIQNAFLPFAQTQARSGHYSFDAVVFSRYDLEANVVTV